MTKYIYIADETRQLLATINEGSSAPLFVRAAQKWAEEAGKPIEVCEQPDDVVTAEEFYNKAQAAYIAFLDSLPKTDKNVEAEFDIVTQGISKILMHVFSAFTADQRAAVMQGLAKDVLEGAYQISGELGVAAATEMELEGKGTLH